MALECRAHLRRAWREGRDEPGSRFSCYRGPAGILGRLWRPATPRDSLLIYEKATRTPEGGGLSTGQSSRLALTLERRQVRAAPRLVPMGTTGRWTARFLPIRCIWIQQTPLPSFPSVSMGQIQLDFSSVSRQMGEFLNNHGWWLPQVRRENGHCWEGSSHTGLTVVYPWTWLNFFILKFF